MRRAAALLALLFVPLAVVAGIQRAEVPQATSLAEFIAAAWGAGAIALWAAGEAATWWRRRVRGSAGGWR